MTSTSKTGQPIESAGGGLASGMASRTVEPSMQGLNQGTVQSSGYEKNIGGTAQHASTSSVKNPATASAQPQYDIQMDQFQVIDSKDKGSFMASPSIIHSTGGEQVGSRNNDPHTVTGGTVGQSEKGVKREQNDQNAKDGEENQFFLTGVNVRNQDIEQYAVMEKQEAIEAEPVSPTSDEASFLAQEELNAATIDKYKMIAVVDSGRSLSNNECVYVNMNKSEICHLSVDSHTSLKFDELVSSYEQVFKIGKGMAYTFMTRRNTNKVILNVSDQFATNNNCGFNLANFKMKFLKNYFNEVVQDYERSFIGSFAHSLLQTYMPNSGDQFELFFTIAKFEGNMGYSLTQNQEEVKVDINYEPQQSDPTVNSRNVTLEPSPAQGEANLVDQEQKHSEMNTTRDVMEAKGLQGNEMSPQSHNRDVMDYAKNQRNKQVHERRQEILKKGSIPEFVQVADAMDYYQVYQEANHRNKVLVESQRQQAIENMMKGEPVDASKLSENENLDLKNIKDDIVIMQFKLVRKDTMKILNTQTFINVPISKMSDINIGTLMEIIQKQNSQMGSQASSNPYLKKQSKKEQQFLPYNKSILTRILYPCLNKSNFLVINHYSKKTILRHLRQTVSGYQVGPAKGLFSSLFRLGFDMLDRLKKRKLQQQAALKILQRTFKTDLTGIYKEIEMFREGIKSFEVYTEQTANQLAKAGMPGASSKSNPLTMFHQIMHFLVLQEEMTQDAETFCLSSGSKSANNVSQNHQTRTSTFFPSLLPEEEIQKVIFDSNYLDYISKKQYDQQMRDNQVLSTSDIYQSGSGNIYNAHQLRMGSPLADIQASGEQNIMSTGSVQPTTSVSVAAQMAKESMMPLGRMQQAATDKQKQLQFVQYECVKSELKEEYDKRVNFLNKRLNKKAQVDPSFLLLNSMASQPLSTKNPRGNSENLFQGNSATMDMMESNNTGGERAKQLGQQMQLQKKILGGPKNRLAKSRTAQGAPVQLGYRRRGPAHADYETDAGDERKQSKQQKKAEYYKFYLDNAQKAIDIMIEKHKSQGSLSQQHRVAMRSGSGGRGGKSQSSADNMSQEHAFAAFDHNRGSDPINIQSMGAGIGYGAYKNIARPTKIYDGVGRSNSLHERRFNPATEALRNQQRLEPLVQRHQKISRITVRNQNDGAYESNHLEQIEEGQSVAVPAKSVHPVNSNQRRSKPFSANQNTKPIRVIQETPGMNQAASTYHTSSFKPAGSTATQNYMAKHGSQVGPTQTIMNGTVLSSNESNYHDQRFGNGTQTEMQKNMLIGQDSSQGGPMGKTSDGNIGLQNNQANHILNYSSDQNLHDRRPVTSGNQHLPQNQRLQMQMSEDSQGAAVRRTVGANPTGNYPVHTSQGIRATQRPQKTIFSNLSNNKAVGANKSFNAKTNATGSMLPPTGPRQVTGGNNTQARRILTNQGGSGRGVRGELLTNGFKSLRAQGMLRANKLDGEQGVISGGTNQMGNRKGSQELDHVNICIEKTYNDEGSAKALNSQRSKGAGFDSNPSPQKYHPNLVPKGLVPKKEKSYSKVRSAKKSGKKSAAGTGSNNQQLAKDSVRKSQSVDFAGNEAAGGTINSQPGSASKDNPVEATITAKGGSAHIAESNSLHKSSGGEDMILVQDAAQQQQVKEISSQQAK